MERREGKPQTVGNRNLISGSEARMADYLKKKNLDNVNSRDEIVTVHQGLYVKYIKRLLDLLLAIPAFVVTFPFNLIFGVCTFF